MKVENVDCVDSININPNRKPMVVTLIKLSTLYACPGFLQCVGFVQAGTALVNGSPLSIDQHAINYATKIPDGYAFIENFSGVNIKVDDLPIWDYDTYGHIAYVLNAYSNHVFQVAEANAPKDGYVGISFKTTDSPNFIGFLRRQ
ncbi:hypothetical protein A3J20_03350 [Candidatus Gottesmanbacteria bacterium RIFCSPLOWO2_02_FULL_42_29]|uniref:Peptidase C51 domain-containing protein n=2 Tax=Candidatus Gottesmaniibacteriota TaxID=1752720 RepID=A0A1F6BET6_9BACT|nr:MAG: hypothetical protein UV09_C0002G0036 [Candidatus Gottesmanbacteria bacterium GW2011_GWA2_42_18]OGG12212.1 MAG: hypothetical protein A2781_04835 [Candidatus Gottesmanbacteria bacterium RIFCSPHIGHO2_01_FULL_42_27]OGG21700.1 MAG: hypothetical protein A3E72_04500 [Candidatus Gottesmanbacteria bacterium RIFCSPHIGHO2_12_FULL_43_26]OGG34239.1 MAG: hypothetical protein A3G68_02965 [Candidatus Gottesmanbacteria bacterium RIFCSPLOWO2_12_FULL_42_10]OGG35037.1 MAG: hypothetical protein A2968_00200 